MDAIYVARDGTNQEQGQPVQHQCAWCLRLINEDCEPISAHPQLKLYEATHGICCECGLQWIQEVLGEEKNNSCDEQNADSYTGGRKMRALLAHLSPHGLLPSLGVR